MKNGEITYEPEKRVRIEITGTVQYRFYSDNIVHLHYKEEGKCLPVSSVGVRWLRVSAETELGWSKKNQPAVGRGGCVL